MQEMIAVKIESGASNMDLLQQGFETGVAIKCPQCEMTYRLFQRNTAADQDIILKIAGSHLVSRCCRVLAPTASS